MLRLIIFPQAREDLFDIWFYIAEAQGGGIAGLAARVHLGRESMYKMLSASGNPKLSSFIKVVEGLGFLLKIEAYP